MAIAKRNLNIYTNAKSPRSALIVSGSTKYLETLTPMVFGDQFDVNCIFWSDTNVLDEINGNSDYLVRVGLGDIGNLMAYQELNAHDTGHSGSLNLSTTQLSQSLDTSPYKTYTFEVEAFDSTGGTRRTLLTTPVTVYNNVISSSIAPSVAPSYYTKTEADARFVTNYTASGGWLSGSDGPYTFGYVGIGAIGSAAYNLYVSGNIGATSITCSAIQGTITTSSYASYAETLDGLDSKYFLTASNIAAGVLPTGRLTGSYGITSSWAVNALTASRVEGGTSTWYPVWMDGVLSNTSSIEESGSIVYIAKNVGVGTNSVTTGNRMQVDGKLYSSVIQSPLMLPNRISGSTNVTSAAAAYTGSFMDGTVWAVNGTHSVVHAVRTLETNVATSTQTDGTVERLNLRISGSSGQVGEGRALDISLGNYGGKQITNLYGEAITFGGTGTVTSSYGLYVGAMVGTNKHGLYVADTGNKATIQGTLGVGTTGSINVLRLGTPQTAVASINIASGSTPSSYVEGDLHYDGTRQQLQGKFPLQQSINGIIFVQNTNVTKNGGTTGEQTLLSGRGTVTLPTGYLQVGKVIKIKATGNHTLDGTSNTVKWGIKMDSTTICSGTLTDDSETTMLWHLDAVLVVRTNVANTCDVMGSGCVVVEETANSNKFVSLGSGGSPVSIANTADTVLDLYVAFTDADSDDYVTCWNAIIEVGGL